jgi:hypothetical protein
MDLSTDRYYSRRSGTSATPEGEWTYPPADTILDAAGLRPIQEYIRRRRETVFRFASERYLYTGNVWHPFL